MLTAAEARVRGFEVLALHLEDHEKGAFQEKPNYRLLLTQKQLLQLQYLGLVEENIKLRSQILVIESTFQEK